MTRSAHDLVFDPRLACLGAGQYGVRKSARMGEKLMRRARTMVPAHGSARVGAAMAAASIAAARRGWQQ
jgi:hypothetical protein